MEVLIALAVVLGLASVMAWTEHRYRCATANLGEAFRRAHKNAMEMHRDQSDASNRWLEKMYRDAAKREGSLEYLHERMDKTESDFMARIEVLHDRANENVIAALQAVRPGTVIRYTPLRPDAAPMPSPVTVEREAALRRPIIRNDAEQLAAESMSRAHHARDLEPA